MALSSLTVSGLAPILRILGDRQIFEFTQNNTFFGMQNLFTPTLTTPSILNWEFKNNTFSGYRWTHLTDSTGGAGTIKLTYFLNDNPIGIDVLSFTPTGTFFNLPAAFPYPVNPTDVANKAYIDAKTWTTNQITNFISSVLAFRLDELAAPASSLNLNNQKIIGLATPVALTDGANKGYVDNSPITLIGSVSGTGALASSITTTLNTRLDQVPLPTASVSLNNQKITNLSTPIVSTDASTKKYVDDAVSGLSTVVTLTGDVTATGPLNAPVSVSIIKKLNEFPAPTAVLNLNNQRIQNLGAPVIGTDATNQNYVNSESNIAGTANQIVITGSNPKLLSLASTTVTPGSYTNTNLTVGQDGRITSASNGSGGGGGDGDTFQTLPYSSNVIWNFANGNIATITLTGDAAITPIVGTVSKGVLIVKQDSIGGRVVSLPVGVFRQGSTSPFITLSAAPNSIDILNFQKDVNNNLYFWNATYQFIAIGAIPTNKFIYVYDGAIKTLPIQVSANNVCRIKVLGAGGGQGAYNFGSGNSGAGGYTIFQFNTTSYIGQEIKLIVGGGGGGAEVYVRPGAGGYPNGGMGISGDTYCGGGGGRSDVRIGVNTIPFSAATIVAIAGGGGGGTGYSGYGGAGGGQIGQSNQAQSSTGGSQTAGGISGANPPALFLQAGFLQGAGATSVLTGQGYDTGGGGDGYYGGGCGGGDGQTSSGGSGYINNSFNGFISSYNGVSSGTFPGDQMAIATQAYSDSDFNDGAGVGRIGVNPSPGVIGMNGGNGKIVVEFL